jgi:hypothetical protein
MDHAAFIHEEVSLTGLAELSWPRGDRVPRDFRVRVRFTGTISKLISEFGKVSGVLIGEKGGSQLTKKPGAIRRLVIPLGRWAQNIQIPGEALPIRFAHRRSQLDSQSLIPQGPLLH